MRQLPLTRRFAFSLAALLVATALSAVPRANQLSGAPAGTLPALSDAEFWRLTSALSEPDGTFHSENLVSNEARFQGIVPDLVKRAMAGRAYVGVGSEQNFTYITALKPTHAFILDIRHGNLDLHLLYKAFFELSADRAEFVSRVFARPRPAGLTTASTAKAIFDAFESVRPSQTLYDKNLAEAVAHLSKTHGFALSAGDRQGLAYVYNAWFTAGPNIRYALNGGGGGGNRGGGGGRGGGNASYAGLMTASDAAGKNWSYLANEESFRFLKGLETRNRVVPIVGNFGGPKALRAVATYLRQNRMVVSAFYTSNVQQYLIQDNIWNTFCASAATLPMDATSIMIRSQRAGFSGAVVPEGGFRLELLSLPDVVKGCAAR